MSEQPAPAPSPVRSRATPADQPRVRAARFPPARGALKRDSAGLVAAIVQQFDTNEVLMLGWMDDEALHRTMTTGRVTFYSRSRQEYWRKGDTSGHVQWVKSWRWTATAMRCWSASTRSAPPATPGPGPASTAAALDVVVGQAG